MTYPCIDNLRVLKMKLSPTATRCSEVDLAILYNVEAFR